MKTPHFFKAYCRLGLPNPPIHHTKLNIGVEDAPDMILDEDFLKSFSLFKVSKYVFPRPEDVNPQNYWEVLVNNMVGFKNLINENLTNGQLQIAIGGDNSITFASLLAVLERIEDSKKVGYIQFDSHGEANSFAGSISKNFHGMYLRPFLEEFDIKIINDLVPNKLPSENFLTIGNQDLDPDEVELYHRLNIKNFNKNNIAEAEKFVKQIIQNFAHIHINFDVDVFDKSISSATGIPKSGGFFPQDLWPLLKIIKNHARWSMDLVEVNPKRDGAEKTIKLAQQILEFMLK